MRPILARSFYVMKFHFRCTIFIGKFKLFDGGLRVHKSIIKMHRYIYPNFYHCNIHLKEIIGEISNF